MKFVFHIFLMVLLTRPKVRRHSSSHLLATFLRSSIWPSRRVLRDTPSKSKSPGRRKWLKICAKNVALLSVGLIAFTVEVRLKADVEKKKEDSLFMLPEGCWSKEGVTCSLKTSRRERLATADGATVTAQGDAVVYRDEQGLVHLVRGKFWISSAKEALRLRLLYGDIWVAGEALVDIEEDRIRLAAHQRLTRVTPIGISESYILPAGYQTWIFVKGALENIGYEIPQVVVREQHLREWAQFFEGDREKFKEVARHWLTENREVASDSGDWKSEKAKEWILLQQKEESLRVSREREIREERARLRALFREKNYLN